MRFQYHWRRFKKKQFSNYDIDTTLGKVVVTCPVEFGTAIRDQVQQIEGINSISPYAQGTDTTIYISITARANPCMQEAICKEIENIVKVATNP